MAEDDEVPIPQKQWYQFKDWLTRQDELQQATLEALNRTNRLLATLAPTVIVPPPEVIVTPVLTKPVRATKGENYNVLITTTAKLICGAYATRTKLLVQNLGAGKLYLALRKDATTTEKGIELDDGDAYEFTDYTGEVWGISESTSDVRVQEEQE
jgi:hypothetical protein